MRNLQELIAKRSETLSKNSRSSFNTNDFLLETLLNKTMERSDVINLIIEERLKRSNVDLDKVKADELNSLIDKLYKTSKNGLDTSVSDSQNNSSFSYNESYDGYKLIKKGSTLSIIEDVK